MRQTGTWWCGHTPWTSITPARASRAGRSCTSRSGAKTCMGATTYVSREWVASPHCFLQSTFKASVYGLRLPYMSSGHSVWVVACLPAGGYGFCHIPTAPGTYDIDCPTWIPEVHSSERRPIQHSRGGTAHSKGHCAAHYCDTLQRYRELVRGVRR